MFGECHGHIFMDGVNYREMDRLYSAGGWQKDVHKKLQQYRDAGITFFRDGGDHYGASMYARSVAKQYGIDYRSPVYAIHKEGCYGGIVGNSFSDLKEYHALVMDVRKQKGDFIKVMFSGIMQFSGDGSVTGTPLDRETIREMIHIAHEEGFSVMAHVNGAAPILDAIEAGVDSIEHGNFMDDECLHALAESRTIWVPTVVTIANLLEDDRFPRETMRLLYRKAEKNISRAMKLGAVIAAGSDAGAYRVLHVSGISDEYKALKKIAGTEIPDLDNRLELAENEIRERFRHG